MVENVDYYDRLLHWMDKHKRLRNLALTVLAFIPNPFFDLAGIAAGALKIPVLRFLFFVAIGQILKMMMFAFAGASSLNWFYN